MEDDVPVSIFDLIKNIMNFKLLFGNLFTFFLFQSKQLMDSFVSIFIFIFYGNYSCHLYAYSLSKSNVLQIICWLVLCIIFSKIDKCYGHFSFLNLRLKAFSSFSSVTF